MDIGIYRSRNLLLAPTERCLIKQHGGAAPAQCRANVADVVPALSRRRAGALTDPLKGKMDMTQ